MKHAALTALVLALSMALALPLPALAQSAPAQDEAAAAREKRRAERQRVREARDARRKAEAEEAVRAARNKVQVEPKAPATTPPAAPTPTPTPAPANTTTPAAPNSQLPELKPFETGIDYKPTSPGTPVTFNLEDASLTDLVRLISQITGKRFILPSTTRSIKATVYAPTKVTAAEAYQAFLSILELNGMALVPAGRYLKIVESGRVEGRPIPLYTAEDEVPQGDRFVTRLQRVNNISAEDAAQLLERFKSGDGSITAYAPTNMMIITDTGTNIQRMLRILDVIDVAHTGEQIWVEPVHHANATEIAARLTEIFEPGASAAPSSAPATPRRTRRQQPEQGAAAGAGSEVVGARGAESRLTKIIADERTNSLIILATERMYLRILEMLKYLDISMEGEGKIHVHNLQHTDAEEIAGTLQSLVGGRGAAPAGGKGAAAGGGAAGDSVFEGKVAITAHKGSNALVITSSTHDYAALRHVIDVLDTERRQVFIEAVIMELSVDRSNSFGLSFHGGIPNVPTEDSVSVLGFRALNTIGGLQGLAANGDMLSGLAVGVQGPAIDNSVQLVGLSLPGFGVAINAMAASGDANILSTPHLIATDNVEAEISVGQNVPLQTSGSLGGLNNLGALAGLTGGTNTGSAAGLAGLAGLSGLGGLGGFGGAVPRQDVGTTVTITPHINDSSEIRLEIAQEISSAGAPSEAGDLGVVSIDRTRAKTELVVRDQQTVVIGGLMRDQITRADTKVPVLGDIPLIGALFRSSTKHKIKKNLLLFLTPYIIRSPADLRSIYERKMRERQEFLDRYFVFSGPEYEPPMDYSRTRGLVGEILLELDLAAEAKRLADEAAMRPELTHEARKPVGQAPEGALRIEPEGEVEGPPEGAPEGVTVPAPAPGPVPPPEAGGPPPMEAPPAPTPAEPPEVNE